MRATEYWIYCNILYHYIYYYWQRPILICLLLFAKTLKNILQFIYDLYLWVCLLLTPVWTFVFCRLVLDFFCFLLPKKVGRISGTKIIWPVGLARRSGPVGFMHKNLTRTKTSHTTFFKITSTKYPNFTVKPLYLLWCCRGEDNLGIGLLASKKAVQYISRSLLLAQSFRSYDVSKSTGQTTSKWLRGPTYSSNNRRKDPKCFRILSTTS